MRHLTARALSHPHLIGHTRQGAPVWSIGGGAEGDPPTDPPADPPNDPPADPPPPDKGYPDNTPVAEMEPAEQAAYWKAQSRKHEGRARAREDYDDLKAKADELAQLKAANQTDHEKAIDAAKAEATTQARSEFGARLVDAEIRAVSAGRLTDDQRTVLLDGLDRTRFLTADGEVDTDKVATFVDGIAPASNGGGNSPDLGQGRRQGTPKASVSAGHEMFENRKKK